MKNKIKKGLSLLCATMLMAGCSGNQGASSTVASQSSSEETSATQASTQETTTERPLTEGEKLAEQYNGFVETPMDLGGRVIRICTPYTKRYMPVDGQTKDSVGNDLLKVMEAIESIEKDYNCKIEFEKLSGSKVADVYLTARAAGDVYSDIAEFGVSDVKLEQLYSNNIMLPLETENINNIISLENNPWLAATSFGEMFDHQYGVHFKVFSASDIVKAVCIFNKELAKKYGYESDKLYEMVRNKEWTYEKFREVCADIATKSTSDGVYPFTHLTESLFGPAFIYANGGTVVELDPTTKKFKYTAVNDKTLYAMNYLVDLITKGYMHPYSGQNSSSKRSELTTMYVNGEAVFNFTLYAALRDIKSGVVQSEYEFGLLPCPIGPNGDGEYSAVTYTENLFHIINGAQKPEELAAIIVAIANRASKSYDVLLEDEAMYSLFDEGSVDMLEILYGNVIADVSRTSSETRGQVVKAMDSVFKLEKTPKEALEEIEGTMQTAFDNLILQDAQ